MTRDEILAIKPGPELNMAVAEGVFGKPRSHYDCPHFDENGRMLAFCACPNLPRYSTDIAAAWQVVEKLLEDGWGLNMDVYKEEGVCYFWVYFLRNREIGELRDEHSFPGAICKTALLTTLEVS